MEFSDDEIRDELARLGYQNVPSDKLEEFKKDLLTLIQAERTSKNNSLNSSVVDAPVLDRGMAGQEFIEENFTNHGSHEECRSDWPVGDLPVDSHQLNFREDWDYTGEPSRRRNQYLYENPTDSYASRRAQSATTHHRVPGSYALHEMPIDLDHAYSPASVNASNNMDLSTQNESGKVVKRKTSRKTTDGARRIDESFTESETDDIFNIYQKIKTMAVRDCDCGKKGTSRDVEPPYRQKNMHKKTPGNIILRKSLPPHERNLKKISPFVMMDKYEKFWKQRPAPGEADRAELCKKIHQKMLQKHEFKVDNKVYVPNTFKIPSEKARTALRWRVRSALEKYELPEHGIYHDI